ncbi:MAG: hypothetical protein KTR25_04090 [Myxococcales bacterium]|nr:hypothetical protein [Myxococcales bacterium]
MKRLVTGLGPKYVRVALPNDERFKMDTVTDDSTRVLKNVGGTFTMDGERRKEVAQIIL